MRHDDILFRLNKACVDGDLEAVKTHALQWKGLTFGRFLGSAVESNHKAIVEYLLDYPIDPSQIGRSLQYAIQYSYVDLITILADRLDDYHCGDALQFAARYEKTAAVEMLLPYSPPHFTFLGLVQALVAKNDDIINILGPRHTVEQVGQHFNNRSRGEYVVEYFAQWKENQRLRSVLTQAVDEKVGTEQVRRKI